MSDHLGKKVWAFPDAFLPAEGHPYKTTDHGDQFGHESLCIVNYSTQDANIQLDFLYEDQDPIENYSFSHRAFLFHEKKLQFVILGKATVNCLETPYK